MEIEYPKNKQIKSKKYKRGKITDKIFFDVFHPEITDAKGEKIK